MHITLSEEGYFERIELWKCRSVEVAIKFACLAGISASTLVFSGCATPPTREEIRQAYRDYRDDIDDAYNNLIEACDTLEGQAKADCIASAMEWRRAAYTLANEGYHDAINERWEDLRERKRLLEKELLEMLPNFPDLDEIFNLTGALDLSNNGQYRIVVGSSPIGGPIPVEVLSYDFTGNITIDREADDGTMFADPASCTGSLDMNISFTGLQASGVVRSGSLVATMGNGQQVTLTVVKDTGNTITTDVNGIGSMVFLAKYSHTLAEWEALLPELHRVYLPVRIVSSNNMIVNSNDSQLGTIVPFEPMVHSDYNQDGSLDYNTDYVAFLAGHLANEDMADVNHDFIWDQEDIDLWIWDFENDLEHIQ